MTIENQKKLAAHIFRTLKVQEIVFPIGRTNKGNLGLKFSSNNDEYEIMLDAVPLKTTSILEDENNIELKKMLEKYLFDKEEKGFKWTRVIKAANQSETNLKTVFAEDFIPAAPKQKGRPKGSKNKSKEPKVEVVG